MRAPTGLHHPGDIATGALIGMGPAYAVHAVARRPLTALVAAQARSWQPWSLAIGVDVRDAG